MTSLNRKILILNKFFKSFELVNVSRTISTSCRHDNSRIHHQRGVPFPKIPKQRDKYTVLKVLAATQTHQVEGAPEYGLIDDMFYTPNQGRNFDHMLQAQKEGEKVAEHILKQLESKLPIRHPVPAWPEEKTYEPLGNKPEQLKQWIETGAGSGNDIVTLYKSLCIEETELPIWVHNIMIEFSGHHLLPGDKIETTQEEIIQEENKAWTTVSMKESDLGNLQHRFTLHEKYLPVLIGKQGSKLQWLMDTTGCKVDVQQNRDKRGSLGVVIAVGSRDQMDHCMQQIEVITRWVDQNEVKLKKIEDQWASHMMAEQIFNGIKDKADANTFEIYIMTLLKHKQTAKAFNVLNEMAGRSFRGSHLLYNTLLENVVEWGMNRDYMENIKAITQAMKAAQVAPTIETFNLIMRLITSDTSGFGLDNAQKVLTEMRELQIQPNVETFIHLLKCYSRNMFTKRDLVEAILEAVAEGKVALNQQPHNDSLLFLTMLNLPGLYEEDATSIMNVLEIYVKHPNQMDPAVFEAFLKVANVGKSKENYQRVVPKLLATPSKDLLIQLTQNACRARQLSSVELYCQELKRLGHTIDNRLAYTIISTIHEKKLKNATCHRIIQLCLEDIKRSSKRVPEDIPPENQFAKESGRYLYGLLEFLKQEQ